VHMHCACGDVRGQSQRDIFGNLELRHVMTRSMTHILVCVSVGRDKNAVREALWCSPTASSKTVSQRQQRSC